MTTQPPGRQRVRILSEIPQVTYPEPGKPRTLIALTYQVDSGPPRTVWIPEDDLPDAIYLRLHPDGPAAPPEVVRQGDVARKKAIRADIDKRRAQPPGRTLEV